jgi:hypothetical protein
MLDPQSTVASARRETRLLTIKEKKIARYNGEKEATGYL